LALSIFNKKQSTTTTATKSTSATKGSISSNSAAARAAAANAAKSNSSSTTTTKNTTTSATKTTASNKNSNSSKFSQSSGLTKAEQDELNQLTSMNLDSKLEAAQDHNAYHTVTNQYKELIARRNQLEAKGGIASTNTTANSFMDGSIATSSGNNKYDKAKTSPGQQTAPDHISKEFGTSLAASGAGNTVDVVDENGKKIASYNTSKYFNIKKGDQIKSGDIVQYGGVSYVYNSKTGQFDRLMDYKDTNTITTKNGKDEVLYSEQYEDANGNLRYRIVVKSRKQQTTTSTDTSSYIPSYTPNPDPPAPKPPAIQYKDIKRYTYGFGIDSLKISYNKITDTACFVSDKIFIGDINDSNYISIDANDYHPEYTSIEYYIIDGSKTVPILNRNTTYIEHELLFPNMSTRFSIADNSAYTIYKNFQITNLKLDEIDFTDKNIKYTISYKPVVTQYKPENKYISIKVILRKYQDDVSSPYIKYINVVKTGGGLLWQDISQI